MESVSLLVGAKPTGLALVLLTTLVGSLIRIRSLGLLLSRRSRIVRTLLTLLLGFLILLIRLLLVAVVLIVRASHRFLHKFLRRVPLGT
jgi:hypothetical protein